ncbi:MAG TPA: plastocyanin/azurin family copper-binding protein [Acidimicrobiales bacterium]|nr:plastocyanin/azurin family copper-binding protein [Acidimicrobiales bacterium]
MTVLAERAVERGAAADPPPTGRCARRARRRWLLAAVAAVPVVAGAAYGVAAIRAGEPEQPVLGPGEATVEVDVEHSLFSPTELRVAEGTRVRFVVVNGDPINHELIVGPPAVHARHAQGTEAEHSAIPGEVSVGPGDTAVTTFRFDEAGTFEFACHLPGHYEYGMRGDVVVVPAPDRARLTPGPGGARGLLPEPVHVPRDRPDG